MTASAAATNVNVNNTLAYRRGEYYRVELSTNNGSAAVWQGVTNRVVQNGTTNTVTGNVFLPQTPEIFSHDADGNLTNDGHWAYVWDAENRLTRFAALRPCRSWSATRACATALALPPAAACHPGHTLRPLAPAACVPAATPLRRSARAARHYPPLVGG